MDTPITVVLVEDDAPTRRSLAASLNGDPRFELLASCETCAQASEALTTQTPGALVTDLQLPDGHGRELITLARRLHPTPEIMVISVLGDERSVVEAISHGASGYLLKDATPAEFRQSIVDLVSGQSPISTSVARHIIKSMQPKLTRPCAASGPKPLTRRESDILQAISKGFAYKEIARMLGMSHQTVPTHIKSIYRKLEVHSRSEAVFEAAQKGLIQLG